MRESSRRHFLAYGGTALLPALAGHSSGQEPIRPTESSPGPSASRDDERAELDLSFQQIARQPILQLSGLEPVTIDTVELLRADDEYLVRVRSKEGAVGIAMANSDRMADVYPIFVRRVAPFFVGKDASQIESLLVELYRAGSNYKFQGLSLWVCVAAVEMAILDLLGQITAKSIAEMFGGVLRKDIDVYRASGNRGNTPEAEIDYLRKVVEQTGAKAIKFRLGGRMNNNDDSPEGRSEALIPLVRKEFGDAMTLYADANSSYDVPHAIRIGRMMEEFDYAFFEEPVPFDHLWETQQVAAALEIPVAAGEQEFSMRRFCWSIAHRVMDVVQPDLHYFGGFIRCAKVARMANSIGLPCTAHMSGSGLGYLAVLHFAAFVQDPGPHQEFKGMNNIPVTCETSTLQCVDGKIRVPTGPGFGVVIAPDFLAKCVPVRV